MQKYTGIFILLFCSFFTKAQDDIRVNITLDNESLSDVFEVLEKDYDISFSYSDELIKDIKVSGNFDDTSLSVFLTTILKNEKIKFEFIEEKYVLISPDENKQIEEIDTRPPPLSLCGSIQDELTKEGLSYANVYIINSNIGTTTDDNGDFQLKGRFSKTDSLEISFMGYQTQRFVVSELLNQPCRSFIMKLDEYESVAVKVTGYLMDGIYLGSDANEVKIQPDKMNILPGQIEPDVMESIRLLPGVSSPDESASKLHIRGGTPDQNLVLWDGIPMYHTGHFFGSISAFNPYIVDEVNVWRGNFGPEYGGRVSGIIDINSTQDIPEKIKLGAGLNFTHGHAFTEVPIWKDKSALVVSYRRSFTDFWDSPTYNNLRNKIFQGTKIESNSDNNEEEETPLELINNFSFYDMNAKWLLNPSEKDKIHISTFAGRNSLDYEVNNSIDDYDVRDELRLKNWGVSGEWTRDWNKKLSSKFNTSYSDFEYNYQYIITQDSINNPIEHISKSNTVEDIRLRLESKYAFNEKHQLNTGYHFTVQNVAFNIDETFLLETGYTESNNGIGQTQSIFLDYGFQNEKWLLNGGLRYNYFNLANAHFLEPRFSIQWQATPSFRLKLNGGLHHQFISQLIELDFNTLGVNNEIWILADEEENSVIRSQQLAAGFIFKKKGWQIDVEGYAKRLLNITSLSTSFGSQFTDNFSTGSSDIIGVDVLVKKRWKNYRSWISYTWSNADYNFPELSDNSFPAFHDQRHTLGWMHLFKWHPLEISLGWNYHSGLPYTPLSNTEIETVIEEEEGEEYLVANPVLGIINSGRLPHYHRLDFSMVYTFPHKLTNKWKGRVGFSFTNIYNRDNFFSRTFTQSILDEDDDPNEVEVLEVEKYLIEFTPNILFRIEWN